MEERNMTILLRLKSPRFSLRDCVEIVKRIHNEFNGNITKSVLADVLRLSEKSSGFKLRVSSLKNYGLTESRKGNITITPLAEKILIPESSEEEQRSKEEAFNNVPLFKELYNKHGEKIEKEQFWIYLRDITGVNRTLAQKKAKSISKVYIDSVSYIKSVGKPEKLKSIDTKKRPGLSMGKRPGRRDVCMTDEAIFDSIVDVATIHYAKDKDSKEAFDRLSERIDHTDLETTKLAVGMLNDFAGGDIKSIKKGSNRLFEALKKDLGVQETLEQEENKTI